jgi:hypothetical protein
LQRQKLAPGASPTEKYKRLKVRAHKLGGDVSSDQAVFGYDVCPGVKISRMNSVSFPITEFVLRNWGRQ